MTATAEVSSRPTPSKIISPAPISPVTRPSTVTRARLTLCTTARIRLSLLRSRLRALSRQCESRTTSRRWLALRAEITAAPCDNRTPDDRAAAVAALALAPVSPVVPLVFAGLAVGVKKIGNRRTSHHNRLFQEFLAAHDAASLPVLFFNDAPEARRMNLRAPEALVRIDIPHASQEALIQQQRLDPGAAGSRLHHKFLGANLERIGPECPQLFLEAAACKISKAPESPRIRVAQLSAIIEHEARMSMFFAGLRPQDSARSGRSFPGAPAVRRDRGIAIGDRGSVLWLTGESRNSMNFP